MLNSYLDSVLGLYERTDAIIITDCKGFIEYSIMFSNEVNNLKSAHVTGMHILENYPSLTEETSSIMRVLKNGQEILDERQMVTNYRGEQLYLVNSTFPIKVNGEIIGAIEAAVYGDKTLLERMPDRSLQRKRPRKRLYTLDDIITKSPKMLDIKEKIRRVAVNPSSVLVVGETGTGKELVAQSIHSHSNRSDGPFLSQNCAAIPSTLLESILFGTTRGSYTQAEDRPGLFELANHGTLFLDELNSMDIALQSKILKALEDKEIRRLGAAASTPVDVRVISAVNEDPFTCIAEGRLREDLYYRLGVVQLRLPPLRERPEDIPLLTEHFIRRLNQKMHHQIIGVSTMVMDLFAHYGWPGNIRELQNVMESCFNTAESETVTIRDLPEFLFRRRLEKQPRFDSGRTLPQQMADFEKQLIGQAISETRNLMDAARLLGISRQSLQYKLQKYQF